MKQFIYILITSVVIISMMACNSIEQPPVVVDENLNATELIIEEDTTMVKMLALPVRIDSTKFIYHPIELISNIKKTRGFSDSYKSDYSESYNRFDTYSFSGNYSNFIIENIESNERIRLVDREIRFRSGNIYSKLERNPRVEFVIYTGYDLDTNQDRKLDFNDRTGLFISDLDGRNFKKLTPDFEEFYSYNFIVETDQLYFQTQVDSDKNGVLNNKDERRNYVVDLKPKNKKAIRYDSDNIFKR